MELGWTASRCPSHWAAPWDSWDRPAVSLPIPGLGGPKTGLAVRAQGPGWSVLGLGTGTKA